MRILLLLLFTTTSSLAFGQPQKEIKQQLDSLKQFIRVKHTEAFAANTAYQGEDASRKWKDVYNPENPEELKAAKQVMEELKKALASCNFAEFDTFKQEKESEGTWYIYTLACGSAKKIHFAFLKIKGKYVLGDIDVEVEDD